MSVTKPVFTDDTGRRATVLLWLGRVVVTVSVIVGAAIAFTLTTHIALPGLDGLVSPTLNGSQPEVGIPATPDPSNGLDATDLAPPGSRLTVTPHAKSSTSLRTTSVATRRAVSSKTTTRRSASTPTSPARSTAKPRNSHAASPTTAGRKAGKTTDPSPPGQTRKPVR
jgi:hypothetical protein